MKTTTKTTIQLTLEELRGIVREHFGAKPSDPVYFKIGTTGDDRFGTSSPECVGATIDIELDSQQLRSLLKGK